MTGNLLDFYRGAGSDHRGRTIEYVWSLSHRDLEHTHDYIQWLFPNASPSPVNPQAPVLDEAVGAAFREDSELRARLLESLDVMLDFYGLFRTEEGIRRTSHFADRIDTWLTCGNHNHLRLTRILLCLWTLGCEEEAGQLYDCLERIAEEYPDRVSENTRAYWAEAARRDVNTCRKHC